MYTDEATKHNTTVVYSISLLLRVFDLKEPLYQNFCLQLRNSVRDYFASQNVVILNNASDYRSNGLSS